MDFTALIPNLGLVAAIVIIILFIKRLVSDERKRLMLDPAPSWIWIVAAFAGGLLAALVLNLAKGFKDFNVFQFIVDAFIYAAGAAFIYDTGKVILPEKKDGPGV
jgi:hypothetical protein